MTRKNKSRFIVLVVTLAFGWAASSGAEADKLYECKKPQKFPATGQTTSYQASDDGDIKAGARLQYTDKGNTIIDHNTRLEWEKKTANNTNDSYSWFDAFVFINTLNSEPCFADHCDWRLPNVKELESIVDYGRSYPAIDPIFTSSWDTTNPYYGAYWSSTTYDSWTDGAWGVNFNVGYTTFGDKMTPNFLVMAVRGGCS
jgi:hypothetical protein